MAFSYMWRYLSFILFYLFFFSVLFDVRFSKENQSGSINLVYAFISYIFAVQRRQAPLKFIFFSNTDHHLGSLFIYRFPSPPTITSPSLFVLNDFFFYFICGEYRILMTSRRSISLQDASLNTITLTWVEELSYVQISNGKKKSRQSQNQGKDKIKREKKENRSEKSILYYIILRTDYFTEEKRARLKSI